MTDKTVARQEFEAWLETGMDGEAANFSAWDKVVAWLAWHAATAQSCAGCSKQASDGWALYCVECAEQIAARPEIDIDDRYAGRLALLLECMLIDPHGHWNEAAALLDEYKAEWEKVNPSPPTFMGELMPPERRERLKNAMANRKKNFWFANGRGEMTDHTELRRKAEDCKRVVIPLKMSESKAIRDYREAVRYPATVITLLDEIDALKAAQAGVIENLQAIVDADWRNWQELASPHEFVAWAKRRSAHALCIIEAATKEKAS